LGITGGAPPFSVSWSGPSSGSTNINQTTFSIPNLTSGVYTIQVSDANGCSDSKTVTIDNLPDDLAFSGTPVNGLCGLPASINISISGGAPEYFISWSGSMSGNQSTLQNNYTISGLIGGTYSITVEDSNGCEKTAVTSVSTAPNTLNILATANNGICDEPGTIDVGIVGGSPIYTVSWSGPVSGSFEIFDFNYTIENLPSGNYGVTVSDGNGCNDSNNVTVTNFPTFLDYDLIPQNGVCEQNAEIEVIFNDGLPPFTINWQGPVQGSATTDNFTYVISDLPTGFYQISISDDFGCVENSSTFVNVLAGTINLTASPVNGLCEQPGSLQLSIADGSGPYSISWSGPVSGSTTSNSATYTIPNLPGGSYSVSVSDSNGCTDAEQATVIQTQGNITVAATPQNGICAQLGALALTISGGAPAYSIAWSGPSSGSATSNTSAYTVTGLSSGTYTVTVTDANGCTGTQSAVVSNTAGNVNLSATVNNGICDQPGSIALNLAGGTPGYTIDWSGTASGSATTGGSSYLIQGLNNGTYGITATDANGCTGTGTFQVSSVPNDLAFATTPENGFCGQVGTMAVSISGGAPSYTVAWSGPQSGSASVAGSSYTIIGLTTGQYVVTVIDANGCEVSSTEVIDNEIDNLALEITPFNGGCSNNGYITVEIGGGNGPFLIEWGGPQQGMNTNTTGSYNISNLSDGDYSITVTDANGCADTGEATIDNASNVLTLSLSAASSFCGQDGSIEVSLTGGNPDYNISWNGPEFGSAIIAGQEYSITGLASGLYTVVVYDASGCIKSQSISVQSGGGDVAAALSAFDGTCTESAMINIKILSGTPAFTISWSGPASGSATTSAENYNISGLPEGTYGVTITDSNGCEFSESVAVQVPENTLSLGLYANDNICDQAGSVDVEISGGAPGFQVTWSGGNTSGSQSVAGNNFTIPDLAPGTYSITITDANDCSASGLAQVGSDATDLTLFTATEPGSCQEGGSIELGVDGSAPEFTVTWTGPVNGSATMDDYVYTILNLPGGSYLVNVTDANGCWDSQTVVVTTQGEQPSADFSFDADLLTVDFSNGSSSGSYFWDFGDGETSTAFAPEHEYCDPGDYEVCLTVSNACGVVELCQNLAITIPGDIVILEVQDAAGSAGSEIMIPVTVRNCSLMVSLAGTIQVEDPSVATILGVVPAKISPQFNAGNNSFNYYDNNGVGIPLQQDDVLFYLRVQLTGQAGDMTTIRIVDSPLQIEVGSIADGNAIVLPHISLKGMVTISNMNQIVGAVTTFWGEGIYNAIVDIQNDHFNESKRTDENGNYSLTDIPTGDTYFLEASKDTLPDNGLSTYALFVGQRFILGMSPLEIVSPYQIVAGDANCNDAFTTLDLFIIQQIIIGTNDDFVDCPSWVFIPSNHPMPGIFDAYNVFPYPSRDTITLFQDEVAGFIGVKVGDILGQADPNLLHGDEVDDRNQAELYLHTANRAIQAGEMVELTFTSSNFEEIGSYQFALGFDAARLQFEEFIQSGAGSLETVVAGTSTAAEGRLRVSWFNFAGEGTTAGPDQPLFTIRFTALEDIDDLGGLLRIDPARLRAEGHTAVGEAMSVVLVLDEITGSEPGHAVAGYLLHQNVPNPFGERTFIGFELPGEMEAELIIHDGLGREVKRHRGRFAGGYNRVEISRGDLQSGLYYYTLRTADFTDTKNMILYR
jgi:hypothetical protein